MKYTFDGSDTEYFCTMFKIPENWSKQKRHLIRVRRINLKYFHIFFCHLQNKNVKMIFLKV